MAVFKAGKPKRIPGWSHVSDWGVSNMPKGQRVERHFHDGIEHVIVCSGRVRLYENGKTIDLKPGDASITKMGDQHAWYAVEKSVCTWAVSRLKGRKRPGHLHKEGK